MLTHGTLSTSNFGKLTYLLIHGLALRRKKLWTQASDTVQLYLELDLFRHFCITCLISDCCLLTHMLYNTYYQTSTEGNESYILCLIKYNLTFLKLIFSYKCYYLIFFNSRISQTKIGTKIRKLVPILLNQPPAGGLISYSSQLYWWPWVSQEGLGSIGPPTRP